MSRSAVLLALAGAALLACSNDPNLQDGALATSRAPLTATRSTKLFTVDEPIRDQYIVVLRDGAAGAASVSSIAAEQVSASKGQLVRTYEHALRGYVLRASEVEARKLLEDPRVKYVQQDGVVHMDENQSSPPWGLDRIDHRIGINDQLYSYNTTGAGVTAYIIDTGIRITHHDFGGRAEYGFDAVGDGNGANDCQGHGTHVSGTVGGATYGVAKDVHLVAVRVLDCTGSGTLSGVIAGVDWVTANRVLPAVANMSLGGPGSQAMDDAVTASVASGVVYAVAAGNFATDACQFSPARTPAAITVGAIDSSDHRAFFSNKGTCLDLFAPGVGILSAWNTDDTATNTIQGTSMASPHVAGTAALYLGLNPTATPEQVAAALAEHSTPDQVGDPGDGSPNLILYERWIGGGSGGDTTPPSVSLVSPADGEVVSGGAVPLTTQASDDVGVQGVLFYVDGSWIGSGAGGDPWAFAWDSTELANGPHTMLARAYDAEGNIGSSATITISVNNPGVAVWDPTLMVPACFDQGPVCDTSNLVNGRGPLGPELNAPNTFYGHCPDGPVGTYHGDESLDRIRIFTLDGSPMAPGKDVQVDVTVWAFGDGSSDSLDLFIDANAGSENWTYLTTIAPTHGGQQKLSYTFTLPESLSNVVALRAAFRYGGIPISCDDGLFNDHDDLVFLVGTQRYPPQASFNISCHGLSCTFTDTSTDPDSAIVWWWWSFGDGPFSNEQSPSHVYATAGTYWVSLVVQDSQGMYSGTSLPVTVAGIPPVASFTASCGILSCSFTDASTDEDSTIVSRVWTFGDGYGANLPNPVHAYAADGSYTVALTVTDSQGLSSTTMQTVTVSPPPVIALNATVAKIKGQRTVDLAWNGATSASLQVYRNGVLLMSTANDGAERTTVPANGTYVYRLCQPGTSYCSNNATVKF